MKHNDNFQIEGGHMVNYELEYLINEEYFDRDAVAQGVAKQVVSKGLDSLSIRQKKVYDNFILPVLENKEFLDAVARA